MDGGRGRSRRGSVCALVIAALSRSVPTALALTAIALTVLVGVLSSGCSASTGPTSSPPPAASAGTTRATPSLTPISPSAAASPPAFTATVASLGAWRRALMVRSGSWSPHCPVSLDDLRLVTLTYWGFDGQVHTGKLVVNGDAVTPIVAALRRLYEARFPIRHMVPVDAYGASDERSMEADNTSAFNGRFVEDSTVWSQHAYGRAIDVDPLENPEIKDGKVSPTNAGPYVDRTRDLPGMITAGDLVERAFAAQGWGWGGSWHSLKDYQHFSATGT